MRFFAALERRWIGNENTELHELRAELVANPHRCDGTRIEIDVDAGDLVARAVAPAGGGVIIAQLGLCPRSRRAAHAFFPRPLTVFGHARRTFAVEDRLDDAKVLGLAESGAVGS